MSEGPGITRVRHELRRRDLAVLRVERPSENLIRVVLGGEQLEGFTSLGFDDHVKLIFAAGDPPVMRDFTPRRYDAATGELWIDFVVHEAGPATEWAVQAVPGKSLRVAGPKGSAVIPADRIATHLFVGDETAIPAIARRLEEIPTDAPALVILEAGKGWQDAPVFPRRAAITIQWAERADGAAEGAIEALRGTQFKTEGTFAWVAGESQFARAVRRYLVEQRAFGKGWVKAAGYWQRGHEGAHENLSETT